MPAMRVHTLMPPRDHAHTRPQKDRLICMAETPILHLPDSDSLNQEKKQDFDYRWHHFQKFLQSFETLKQSFKLSRFKKNSQK